jgi:hypothetical protein
MKNFQYICSWKAYLNFNQACEYIIQNKQALKTLGKDFKITICPSFDALSALNHELTGTDISLGAQDCSTHNAGAYTGQVLARSLKEIQKHEENSKKRPKLSRKRLCAYLNKALFLSSALGNRPKNSILTLASK